MNEQPDKWRIAHCALRVVAPHAGCKSEVLNHSAVRDEPEDRGESAWEVESETVLARSTKRKADMQTWQEIIGKGLPRGRGGHLSASPRLYGSYLCRGIDERHASELRRAQPEAKTHGITFRVKRRVLSGVESGTDSTQMGGGRGWRQNSA
ncbi:hypothetical protein DFH09DRAFT_1102716 [Mycena vulgaris]|nr:hypothetical protein DFH09DRAFT_1102716 [Mycena vulgaris]